MLASPYGYDYDMMIVAPAIAFLASDCLTHGCLHCPCCTAVAALWLVPIVARGIASATFIQLASVLIMIDLYIAILRRAAIDAREPRQAPAVAAP